MSIENEPKLSPMMVQWHACKQQAASALLLFRLGDFYEAFYEDASLLAKELDLALTKRQDVPMAGMPHHSSEGYIDRLVAKGYRVAIAEQMEDPRSVKGLVKREVVRVITPGTLVNSTLLSEKTNNFLVCIAEVGQTHALSALDLTTADFRVMEFENVKSLVDELCKLKSKEILISEKWQKKYPELVEELQQQLQASIHIKAEWHFAHAHALDVLQRHFQLHTLDGFGLKGMVAATNACGVILHYVKDELHLPTSHITTISKQDLHQTMLLDKAAQKNLELFESLGDKRALSLLKVIDLTQTPMGGRLLKSWLAHPLVDVEQIVQRQDQVAQFFDNESLCAQVRNLLSQIKDLERLMMRVETRYATPRDLGALRDSLLPISSIAKFLEEKWEDVTPLVKILSEALEEHLPLRLGDTEVFRKSFNSELDGLKALQTERHEWIANYQTHLREETSIKTLKVGYTQAFGYYIEVSRGQTGKIPPHFQRKQTLVNAERFLTEELKAFEHQMLHASEMIAALENQLFHALCKTATEYASAVRTLSQKVGQVDCFLSLAEVARQNHYVRPKVDESRCFELTGARHPVIEQTVKNYISNDLFLDGKEQRLYLITGPNMAGKSTFIRQAAVIAILAQIGSFVPAKKAHIGIIDKVFSRIGASDDLSRGQSTFMVEMSETANILHNATDRSLVILDEIGRGTSTYDGISIAWAVAEYLLITSGSQAKTLFATHYWELTALETEIPGAVNYNVAVQETDEGIVFLHKIVKGSTNKSYGIHVARLAGLPLPVLKRATLMLKTLEKYKRSEPKINQAQLSLFNDV